MNDQSVIKLDKVSEYMLKIHSLNFHFQGSRAGVMEDLSHTMPTFHIYKKHMHNYRKQPKVFGWRSIYPFFFFFLTIYPNFTGCSCTWADFSKGALLKP